MERKEYSNIDITNEEIIKYLTKAYSLLKEAESSLDITRLKHIIEILKRNEKKVYLTTTKREKGQKVNYDLVSQLIIKQKNDLTISEIENEILTSYWKDKEYFHLLKDKNYAELFGYISNNQDLISTNDLLVIYLYLTGNETKLKKKSDVLQIIVSYLNQNIYFNNMDERYNKSN